MIEAVVLSVYVVGLCGSVLYQRHKVRRLAESVGLQIERTWSGRQRLFGTFGDSQVEISIYGKKVKLTIDNANIPKDLELSKEGILTRVIVDDILTGDAEFDHEVLVRGSDTTALAILDQSTRKNVMGWTTRGVEVEKSALKWEFSEYDQLAEVPSLVDLSRQIGRVSSRGVAEQLAINVDKEVMAVTRIRNLRALHASFPTTKLCQKASVRALGSNSYELQLEAAIHLSSAERARKKGLAALVRLASDHALDRNLRARAISNLDGSEESRRVFVDCLAPGPGIVRKAAIRGLIKATPDQSVVDHLESLVGDPSSDVVEEVALAFGEVGGARAQNHLMTLLEHEDRGIRLRAIDSLGRIGSVDAVPALREIGGTFSTSRLASSAKSSIAQIQSRAVGAEQGQLSLVATTELEGALSSADPAAGAGELSLTEGAPNLRD